MLPSAVPVLILLCLRAGAPAAAETLIGMEGTYYLRAPGPLLEAEPVDAKAPITLRIASVVEDRGAFLYELRFIGTRAGGHDLRDYLRRADGGERGAPEPIPVTVKESLPPDHGGELAVIGAPPLVRPWSLRVWLAAAAVVWSLPLGLGLWRRLSRPRARPRPSPPPAPTLADLLRPLVEAAVQGALPPAGKARLEMLLLLHWRARLGLEGAGLAETLGRMREHGECGPLLERLEGWLHRPAGAEEVEVEALLAPYRGVGTAAPAQGPRREVPA